MARKSTYVLIRIKYEGGDEVKERLQDIKDRANDFTPVLKWAGKELERAYSKNFTTLGAISATAMLKGAWPPLDAEYAAWKSTRYPGAPPMVQTGELFRSVASLTDSPRNLLSDTSATYVVDSPIARFHQFGTENMPARKIVFVPRNFDRDLGNKAVKYITEGSKMT